MLLSRSFYIIVRTVKLIMKLNNLVCVLIIVLITVTEVWSEYSDNFTDILDLVPKWENTNLTILNRQIMEQKLQNQERLINNVAYRGDAVKNYRITLRDLNLLTRKHYSDMINHVGYNMFPLLLATDVDHDKRLSGVGSEFILYLRNGTIHTAKPSPSSYEVNKDISHIPLGIFAIISPFFKDPTSPMWHDKLREYQNHIKNSLAYLQSQPLSMKKTSVSVHCKENLSNEEQIQMFTMAIDYIEGCFQRGSVDFTEYQAFTQNFRPLIHKAVKCSAKIQVMSSMRQLKIWKEQLGKEWDDLYVVIPVIWPVGRINPRRQIIELFMKEEKRLTNIVLAEGVKTIQEAREVLGRVVADRTMSELVYRHDTELNIQQNVAFSTKTDMVTPYTEDVLKELNLTLFSLADPYDEPNDLRFDDFYQVPVY